MKFILTFSIGLCISFFHLSAQNGLSVDAYISTHRKIVYHFDAVKFNEELNRYVKNANKEVISAALLRNLEFYQPVATYTHYVSNLEEGAAALLFYVAGRALNNLPIFGSTIKSEIKKPKDYSKFWGN